MGGLQEGRATKGEGLQKGRGCRWGRGCKIHDNPY